jgi:hypothetical protein
LRLVEIKRASGGSMELGVKIEVNGNGIRLWRYFGEERDYAMKDKVREVVEEKVVSGWLVRQAPKKDSPYGDFLANTYPFLTPNGWKEKSHIFSSKQNALDCLYEWEGEYYEYVVRKVKRTTRRVLVRKGRK